MLLRAEEYVASELLSGWWYTYHLEKNDGVRQLG